MSITAELIEISGDTVSSMSLEVLEVILESDLSDAVADDLESSLAFA